MMINWRRVTAYVMLMLALLCRPDPTRADRRVMPAWMDGSMMPIDLAVDEPLSVATGDSLQPLFVNYLARHGARYLSSAKKVEGIRDILVDAGGKKQLSRQGEEFLRLLDRVNVLTAGRWGALDSIGVKEQRTLAQQMQAMFPNLLKDGRVEGQATYVPRVVMSMYEFCHTLGALSPDLDIYTSAGKQNNAELRYFKTNPFYEKFLAVGDWKSRVDDYSRTTISTAPAKRLFKKGYTLDEKKLRKMTQEMYGVLQSLRATGMGYPDTRWMSEDEYLACWRVENLDHFLRRTSSALSALPGEAAAPLLHSFIAYGDSALSGKNNLKAILRFGHAETLMPLFSLMAIEGCLSDSRRFSLIYEHWKDYQVVPLGANLIVVSLKAPSGEIYAAMRLNGRWVSPLSDGKLIARWSDLKAYWIDRLKAAEKESAATLSVSGSHS